MQGSDSGPRRPLFDAVPRLLRAAGAVGVAEPGARRRHAGGHRTLRVRRALAGAGGGAAGAARFPGAAGAGVSAAGVHTRSHTPGAVGPVVTGPAVRWRALTRRARRRLWVRIAHERLQWRRHQGWQSAAAFAGWLVVLWGVVWLAERAGMQ